jgi:TPP-dependent indolepyruvate ferredoxin oxidoreductase alpha subunit
MKTEQQTMTASEAIARGLVEAGIELATACPGTAGSKILSGIVEFKRMEHKNIHIDWSMNEKCAFEVAYGAASLGKKAACFVGQIGLNVAFASIMKALEKPIEGGLVIVSCDDPGSRSSDREQGTGLIASLFNIPVYGSVSPKEAADVAFRALNHSFEHKKPVIVWSAGEGISPDSPVEEALKDVRVEPGFPGIRARCAPWVSFSAIRNAFPEALFLGDAGCSASGAGHGDAHAFLDAGAGVAFAAGLYDAFNQDNRPVQIVVAVEDSLFFRTCLTALYDAAQKEKKFILLIMVNGREAITGMEEIPQKNTAVDNIRLYSMKIDDIVKAFGVSFVRTIGMNDTPLMIGTMREAFEYLKQDRSRPAVIIVRQDSVPL